MLYNADFASSLANAKQVLIGLAHRKNSLVERCL